MPSKCSGGLVQSGHLNSFQQRRFDTVPARVAIHPIPASKTRQGGVPLTED
jgi:hypothetical protein